MASNSEANLPSDFDIDEVINCWGEHINSSKDIGFELEQLGIPNEAKTSQNTTTNHANLSAAVVSSQQTQIPVTKSQALFVSQNNGATITSKKRHSGFPSPRSMVSLTPTFPSENLDIPSINLNTSQTPSLMPFQSRLVQNNTLANQIRTQRMQNVSSFTRPEMDDDDNLIEGPLDKIVDQIMDRELSQAIMKTSAISNTYGQDHLVNTGTIQSPVSSCVVTGTNITSSISPNASMNAQNYTPKLAAESQFNIRPFGNNTITRPSTVNMLQQQSLQLNNIRQKSVPVQKATMDIEEMINAQRPGRSPVSQQGPFESPLPTKSTVMLTSATLSNPGVVKTTNIDMPKDNFNQNTTTSAHLLNLEAGSVSTSQNAQSKSNMLPKTAFVSSFTSVQTPVASTFASQRNATGDPTVVRTGSLTGQRPALVSLNSDKTRYNIQSNIGIMQATSSPASPNLPQVSLSPKTTQAFSIFNPMNNTSTTTTVAQPQVQQSQLQATIALERVQMPKTFLTSTSGGLQQVNTTTPTNTATNSLKISLPGNMISGLQQQQKQDQQPPQQQPSVATQVKYTTQSLLFPSTTSHSPSIAPTTGLRFPNFQLSQSKILGNLSSTPKTSPMVFTLAPGSQASLKGLPLIAKDKITGRQIFLIKQPGQPSTPQMNIVFVNEGSVPQVVSALPKSLARVSPSTTLSSTSPVSTPVPSPVASQPTLKTVFQTTTQSTSESGKAFSPITVDDSPSGSPSSIHSSDSDSLPIAALKQPEEINKKTEEAVKRKRGTKRRKDPNRPVKPLSSFQRFFQKTQVDIRQKSPNATFSDVSKIAKQSWESISPKEKKIYQDAWRSERAQYKKAMAAYEASLEEEYEVDGPSAKQLKNGPAGSSHVSVSPVESPKSVSPAALSPSTTPSPTSPMVTTASSTITLASHGGGKPLAMMLANKTKMTSPPAKTSTKAKATSSNGVQDDPLEQLPKKKQKINPIPKKPCVREDCNKFSRTTKERGTLFCSNECVMMHSRNKFTSWVGARRATLKAT